ncbi:short-chain dehydrogenase [Saccharibacillus sacchari]|uniref:Short-chain dehydrogenase n=1 Tax=Saccharibacillus sacchari TaxID=456493 RepID=A0ACC6P633_9BACL
MENKQALLIGATGMLAEAARRLNADGWNLVLIARGREKLDRLVASCANPELCRAAALDYTQESELRCAIREASQARPGISLVLAWIHSTAPNAPGIVMNEVAGADGLNPFRYVHVIGSGGDPEPIRIAANRYPGCSYRQVRLGFKVEPGGSRWLNDSEISQGALKAIGEDRDVQVGLLEPRELRP